MLVLKSHWSLKVNAFTSQVEYFHKPQFEESKEASQSTEVKKDREPGGQTEGREKCTHIIIHDQLITQHHLHQAFFYFTLFPVTMVSLLSTVSRLPHTINKPSLISRPCCCVLSNHDRILTPSLSVVDFFCSYFWRSCCQCYHYCCCYCHYCYHCRCYRHCCYCDSYYNHCNCCCCNNRFNCPLFVLLLPLLMLLLLLQLLLLLHYYNSWYIIFSILILNLFLN